MPYVPPEIRNAAFYLYPTVEHARKGSNFGGSGFVIGMPSKRHGRYGQVFYYAVTNWHVACQGSPVVRFNTKNGPPDIFEFDVDQWYFDSRYDIAVKPINLNADVHTVTALHSGMLVTKTLVRDARIGPGDDVFMVGRFVDHDGGERNRPALRFGNISADPTPMTQENGMKVDAYCIDLHSRSGYSGSPVFVYRTLGSELVNDPRHRELTWDEFKNGTQFFLILGIHFAQFPEMWEVTSSGKLRRETSPEPLLTEGKYIRGLSGMTCVLPAWYLQEALDMPALRRLRERSDDITEARFRREGYPPEPEDPRWRAAISESVVPPANKENSTR